jgi:hypothetical protein
MRSVIVVAVLGVSFSPLVVPAESAPVHLCKAYVQARIDVLDADMHKGDKTNEANKLLKRRDRLKAQYSDCNKNPNAYKKNL